MQNEPNQFQNFQVQQSLPNATAVLVLGILSIVGCCFYGGGLIFGIIALVLAGKDKKLYAASPDFYTLASYKNVKAGSICAWIGLSLSILSIIMIIVAIATIGIAGLSDPEAIKRAMGQ